MSSSSESVGVASATDLTTFGKYHLIASLGQGGMAKVYLALMAGPSGFNKLLVVKIMRADLLAGSEDTVRMFWAEARLAARLVHHNIVHTYEVGEHDGRHFLAMEYLDGQPLSAILNRSRGGREIPLAELLRIIAEVARGLHYAHRLSGFQGEALDVVHRDVSPQNVLVTYDGQVKVLDFGIAKSADAEHATQLGIVKGKLDYIAPEQLRGEPIDARADIFSLGGILWELITGHRFAGGRKVSDVLKIQTRLVAGERKLRALSPEVSPELEQIVERAIALDPADRWADAGAFADAVETYLESCARRPSARALARQLKELFGVERNEMHRLIDEQVQRIKRGPSESRDSLTEPPPLGVGGMQSGFGLYVSDAHQEDRSSISMAAPSMPRSSTAAPASVRRWKLTSSALTVGVALVLSCWLALRPSDVAPSSSRSTAAQRQTPIGGSESGPLPARAPVGRPQSALPYALEPAARTVTVRVVVEPQQARVTVDGVEVPVPFTGTFRKEPALHHVEATAEGYRAARKFVAFDRDQSIELTLERALPLRRPVGAFQRLIESAAQTTEHGLDSKQALPPKPARGSERDTHRNVLDRPNPYVAD